MIFRVKKIALIIVLFASLGLFAQPGDKIELKSIEFIGNNYFSSSMLSGAILSEESPWWFWKFLNTFTSFGKEPVYFDSSYIDTDMRSLHDFYVFNGFFNPQITYKYEIDTVNKEAHLTYVITENKPSFFRKVQLEGIDHLPEIRKRDLYSLITMDDGKRYMQSLAQENIDNIISALMNDGYMLARLDSTVIVKDTTADRADISIYLTPGNRYTINEVRVKKYGEGSPYVEDQLLVDLVGVNKGDFYNLEKLRRSQIRLYRTGLFKSVILGAVQSDTSGNLVPIEINGNIGSMNELSPEIIFNYQQNAFNIGLGTSYIRKNFFGEARKFTSGASFGVQDIYRANFKNILSKLSLNDTTLLGYLDARITVEQPYAFGKPVLGIFEAFATVRKQPDYNNNILGTKLSFEFELPRYTFINYLSAYYTLDAAKEVYRRPVDSSDTKLTSVIGTELKSFKSDNLLFPTQGFNLSITLEEANIIPYLILKLAGSNFEGTLFYKALFNSALYTALNASRSAVFGIKAKAGYIQSYKGDINKVPINRTFFAGGSNSVRGWRSNELIPLENKAYRSSASPIASGKGGTFLIDGSFELRYRFAESFGFAFFTDYGNSWNGYKNFRINDIAVASGLGFRYYTSIAPFRIDFGFRVYDPLDKRSFFTKAVFKTMEFHFGIGEAF